MAAASQAGADAEGSERHKAEVSPAEVVHPLEHTRAFESFTSPDQSAL